MSLTLIVAGFLLASAVVIVLARTSTRRWEREGRAAVAPRPEDGGVRTTRSRLLLPRAVARRMADALRGSSALSASVTVARRAVGSLADRAGLGRLLPRLSGRLRADSDAERRVAQWGRARVGTVPGQDDTAAGSSPFLRRRRHGARTGRRRSVAGAVTGAGRRFLAPIGRRPHRRLRGLLHRHARAVGAQAPRADGNDTPPAR